MLSHLESLLNQLIAAHEGIHPEDVTLEYIRLQREWRLYPQMRYRPNSDPSGAEASGLKILTEKECGTQSST